MVKVGTLKDFNAAKKMVKDAGIDYTVTNGDLVRRINDKDGTEIVSIARLRGATWAFRYNPAYFVEVA